MIDPLETVLRYLSQDDGLSALVGARIAAKHRYGEAHDGWSVGDASLTVNLDGGSPQIYVPVQDVRLEVSARAASKREAVRIVLRVQELARGTARVVVTTTEGPALLHFLLPDSGLSTPYDPDLGMDVGLQFYRALVGEREVP